MSGVIPIETATALLGISIVALVLSGVAAIFLVIDKLNPTLIDRIADKLFGPHHS